MIISRLQQPLTVSDIARLAPSALAREAYSDRSERYIYIPTVDVIDGMRKAGFLPFAATQSRARDANKREHTKHMIRFRHPSAIESLTVGDSLAEIVLVNSHDGSSSYVLMAGIFRLVCLNGMVVSDSMQERIAIRHQGNVIDAVIEGSTRIVENTPKILDAVNRWTGLQLSQGKQLALAEAAHTFRFGNTQGKVETPITPAQLLNSRRSGDEAPDLWRTLNRVQENVIRGGLHAVGKDAHGRRRRVTTRSVTGIDQDVKLNRALWRLAERMAELKASA